MTIFNTFMNSLKIRFCEVKQSGIKIIKFIGCSLKFYNYSR